MRAWIAALAALLVPLTWSGAVEAACIARIDPARDSLLLRYDPLDGAALVAQGTVTVRHVRGGRCALRLAFGRRPKEDPRLGGRLGYRLEDERGRELFDDRPRIAAPAVFLPVPAVGPGESVALSYRLRVRSGQMVPPGTYRDTVELRLYEERDDTLLDRSELVLVARVSPVVRAQLAGPAVTSPSFYRMDFGELVAGERKTVRVEVAANAGYRVEIVSANGGVLRGPERVGGGYWTVPYEVRFAGRSLRLAKGKTGLRFTAPRGGVASHPLMVVIGDVEGRRAGVYRDRITITVAPDP